MVVWMFAGGGATEVDGLPVFLQKNFGAHKIQRMTPIVHKKAPRPSKYPAPGLAETQEIVTMTGEELSKQIQCILRKYWSTGNCETILVIDDLDCHNPSNRRSLFENAVRRYVPDTNLPVIVGFAAPEIEAWIIADWHNTFEQDYEFKNTNDTQYAHQIRRELTEYYQRNGGDISSPESFSELDPARGACARKLSEGMIDIIYRISGINYSKADHSVRMIKQADANRVQERCPQFRPVFLALTSPR